MNAPTKPRRKFGRKPVMTRATKKRLIEAIGNGLPAIHACHLCRISKSVFYDYRATHPEFDLAIENAVAANIEYHLSVVRKAAQQGDKQASQWLLERLWPQFFSRTRLELTGADGTPLTCAVALYLPTKQESEPRPAVITDQSPR